MDSIEQHSREFTALLERHKRVTVLSHINPDPDAIGTSLGVYAWLKEQGVQVEVANATKDIPKYLDFLPHYAKIKHKIDYDDSLIIACDCGSIDRLGFPVAGREIINIDHHHTNRDFGVLNIVDAQAVASAEVAYKLLHPIRPLSKESATAFYAALLSDTRNFTTSNMHLGVFKIAQSLIELGADPATIPMQMIQRRSLASLRVLGMALDSLELLMDGRVAILTIKQTDIESSGAKVSNMDGIVDYAKSLATVEVAIMMVEHKQHVKVSLRSKHFDISDVAKSFGGGGHKNAGGFESGTMDLDALQCAVTEEIKGVIG